MPPPESAPPETITRPRPGVVRVDRIGLETETHWNFREEIADPNDPLSAVAEMHKSETVSRGAWKTKVEASMRMTCTRQHFRVTASIRAWDGDEQVCTRDWDVAVPRDLS